MEWDQLIDLSTRKFSSRLIVERSLARGWRVCGFVTNPAIFLIYIPGVEQPVKIFSASPPQMSYPAAKIAKDKYITNQILSQAGLPVPREIILQQEYDKKVVYEFMSSVKKLVVKPLDASHGKGIVMNVDSEEKLLEAINEARSESSKASILVQEQLEGIDVRVLCIDYKYVDAISRMPASVTGDGRHTIEELIKITNASDERGENYKAKLNRIPLNKAVQHVGRENMGSVPGDGEVVQVIGVSNIGMGGVRKNIHEQIPVFLQEMAIEAAKTIGLPVCGVDFMVRALPTASSTKEELAPNIIEINECPMLTMYDDLHSEEQYRVIDTYLDYLESSCKK